MAKNRGFSDVHGRRRSGAPSGLWNCGGIYTQGVAAGLASFAPLVRGEGETASVEMRA
jgi:hypothetical protein